MMTLAFYLGLGTDPASIAASAMVADKQAHAMAAACVMLGDLAAAEDATGHTLEATVLRRAESWLQAETASHHSVLDELVSRTGRIRDDLLQILKARRLAATETREGMGPMFIEARKYLSLAIRRGGLDEAEALLVKRDPGAVADCKAVLDFVHLNTGACNDG